MVPPPDPDPAGTYDEQLDQVLDALARRRLPLARRGYSRVEVDELLNGVADAVRRSTGPDVLHSIADQLISAVFTPVDDGYEPMNVRGLLRQAAAAVRAVADPVVGAAARWSDTPHVEDALVARLALVVDRLERVSEDTLARCASLAVEMQRYLDLDEEVSDLTIRLQQREGDAEVLARRQAMTRQLADLENEVRRVNARLVALVSEANRLESRGDTRNEARGH